jgi:hypothetical protein
MDALMAKLTFCGISPIFFCTRAASSLLATTPTRLPLWSRRGPPLLPGWTGAVICKKRGSSWIPAKALTVPVVICASDANKPRSGKPTTMTSSPGRTYGSVRKVAKLGGDVAWSSKAKSFSGSLAMTVKMCCVSPCLPETASHSSMT